MDQSEIREKLRQASVSGHIKMGQKREIVASKDAFSLLDTIGIKHYSNGDDNLHLVDKESFIAN
ncbi:MAG: hypothetical protein KGI29_09580 [Pseudomonadota bacterium]|nr:hypothetical protein [Pseudomonadota bacterium]MDE3038791.1 hypothetical protein [Pseudomonadota bacterium]